MVDEQLNDDLPIGDHLRRDQIAQLRDLLIDEVAPLSLDSVMALFLAAILQIVPTVLICVLAALYRRVRCLHEIAAAQCMVNADVRLFAGHRAGEREFRLADVMGQREITIADVMVVLVGEFRGLQFVVVVDDELGVVLWSHIILVE